MGRRLQGEDTDLDPFVALKFLPDDVAHRGAIWLEYAAVGDAPFGNLTAAKRQGAGGLQLAATSPGPITQPAFAYALAGDAPTSPIVGAGLEQALPAR